MGQTLVGTVWRFDRNTFLSCESLKYSPPLGPVYIACLIDAFESECGSTSSLTHLLPEVSSMTCLNFYGLGFEDSMVMELSR